MPNVWSINTTVRNPERIRGLLIVLKRFEGKQFDKEVQGLYFKEIIKHKQYQLTGLSKKYKKKYEEPEEFTNEELKKILKQIFYTNKFLNNDQEEIYALRGRTAVSSITKMGLAVAKESMGVIKITEIGNRFINNEVEVADLFFRYFLKWQLPSPNEKGYKNFDIIPFIAVMHVIDKVNKKWSKMGNKPIGISKEEFALFLTTLTDSRNIKSTAKQIISFRKEKRNKIKPHEYVQKKIRSKAIKVFGLNPKNCKDIEIKINNLYDYSDSAMRYFRQTKLISYRGWERYIDFSPTRIREIKRLLKTFDGSSLIFSDIDDYLNYMSDINQPALPWENLKDLKKVYETLLKQANWLQNKLNEEYPNQALHTFKLINQQFRNIEEYKKEIGELRENIETIRNDILILGERNLHNIDSYIGELSALANRKKSISGKDPLNLEYYVTLSLMALDDAKEIKPNYSIGDDNIPLFTATGNKPDIECYYSTFNMICEVTLLKGRDQWFNEGQPVMRHLRDFEEKENISSMENYCLFIAPYIHRDTLNTFWASVKMGYEGKTQKIVPLTIQQYINILKIVKLLNENGKRVNHKDFKKLLDEIFEGHLIANNNSTAWLTNIDHIIEKWGEVTATSQN